MNSAVKAYKQNQIQTAPPEKLVLMLYDGAIKFINKGLEAIDKKDIQAVNNNFIRAQDILLALMSGVNFEAGEVAEGFYSLYEYMYDKLIQANVKKDKTPAKEVLSMIEELRDTWIKMLEQYKKTGEADTKAKPFTVNA